VSKENVELYCRTVGGWTRGDEQAWLEGVSAEWEFRSSGLFPGLQPVYRGPEGARKLWTDMHGPWVEFAVQIERIEDLGDTLIALITFVAKGRDGIGVERRWAHVVTYRQGVPTVTENYGSWAEALKAVGLED
jgi:SnoaL-like domain